MDEMRFRTKLGKALVATILSNRLSDKFGCNIKLKIDEFEVTNDDNIVRFKIECSGTAENKVILQLTD